MPTGSLTLTGAIDANLPQSSNQPCMLLSPPDGTTVWAGEVLFGPPSPMGVGAAFNLRPGTTNLPITPRSGIVQLRLVVAAGNNAPRWEGVLPASIGTATLTGRAPGSISVVIDATLAPYPNTGASMSLHVSGRASC